TTAMKLRSWVSVMTGGRIDREIRAECRMASKNSMYRANVTGAFRSSLSPPLDAASMASPHDVRFNARHHRH
ncbi:hypothetical protein M3640_21690, partial [Bacillus velezensis]|nr:hypothetical protein [Bacillus velezensis]